MARKEGKRLKKLFTIKELREFGKRENNEIYNKTILRYLL